MIPDRLTMRRAMRRFFAKVEEVEAPPNLDPALGPCRIWKGAQTRGGKTKGKGRPGGPYGSFGVCRGCIVRTTVFVAMATGRYVPGMHQDHLCSRTLCVAELHIETVTPEVNQARRWEGRRKAA